MDVKEKRNLVSMINDILIDLPDVNIFGANGYDYDAALTQLEVEDDGSVVAIVQALGNKSEGHHDYDMVTITCYGKTKTMEREEAKKLYIEAMLESDGSEQARYAKIYLGLVSGLTEVTDEE